MMTRADSNASPHPFFLFVYSGPQAQTRSRAFEVRSEP